MKTKPVINLVLILFVLMGLSLTGCKKNSASEPPFLSVVSGSVQSGSAGSLKAAEDGKQLAPDATVKTGADGRALLTYKDGSTISLLPDTEITFPSGESIIVKLTAGSVWTASSENQITIDAGGSTATGKQVNFLTTKKGDEVSVSPTGGVVKFKAGGSEIEVPNGQISTSTGSAPSAPKAIEVKNAIHINLKGEALVYLVDPLNRAIGYHPTQEMTTNQIPLGWYSGKEGRPQVISVVDVMEGEYTILLVAAGNQANWDIKIGSAGADLNYTDNDMSSSITWGTPTGITMQVTLDAKGTPKLSLSDIWTLYEAPHGKATNLSDALKRTKILVGPQQPPWTKVQ